MKEIAGGSTRRDPAVAGAGPRRASFGLLSSRVMDFTAYDLRVGTVVEAAVRDGALALTIALGGATRTATAYVTERYAPESVLGRQVVVVANPDGRRDGEVVVLAAVSPSDGAVLLQPDRPVPDGTQVV